MKNEKIVEVINLNKSYGKTKVLQNVSFYVNSNEIVGFIGPNGAGKSTTMKCITNLIYPDSGTIKICGYDLKKNRKEALEQQAALIEAPGLYLDMTGRENINLIAGMRRVSKERVEEIYEFTEIGSALDRKVKGYSMGMKQRLALGIAIMTKPKFVILDEPTNGLDPTGIIHLRNTLQKLMKKEDMSILFSSHQLGEVEKLADRIVCINKGRIIETPKTINDKFNYFIQVDDSEKTYQHIIQVFSEMKIEKVSHDTIRLDLKTSSELNDVFQSMISKNLVIKDVYKDVVDVESVYKEVYGEQNA